MAVQQNHRKNQRFRVFSRNSAIFRAGLDLAFVSKLSFQATQDLDVALEQRVAKKQQNVVHNEPPLRDHTMYRCTFVFVFLACSGNLSADQLNLHVATNGRAQAVGTEADPYASIEQARDHIRSMRRDGELETTSVNVLVHAGRYEQAATMIFTEEDSGTEEFPITYRAIDGEVTISGGVEIRDWQKLTQPELLSRLPESAKDHVVCIDIARLGVSCGELHSFRLHQPMRASAIELFANQQRLPRAKWPNTGWAHAKNANEGTWKHDRPIHSADQSHAWESGFGKTTGAVLSSPSLFRMAQIRCR